MSLPVTSVPAAFVPPAGTVWLGGVARTPAGAIYITTDAPDAAALTCNGLLMTNQGVLYVKEVAP